MGQKVNPKGFRLGVYQGWDSHWFARDALCRQFSEDFKIRKFVDKELSRMLKFLRS